MNTWLASNSKNLLKSFNNVAHVDNSTISGQQNIICSSITTGYFLYMSYFIIFYFFDIWLTWLQMQTVRTRMMNRTVYLTIYLFIMLQNIATIKVKFFFLGLIQYFIYCDCIWNSQRGWWWCSLYVHAPYKYSDFVFLWIFCLTYILINFTCNIASEIYSDGNEKKNHIYQFKVVIILLFLILTWM